MTIEPTERDIAYTLARRLYDPLGGASPQVLSNFTTRQHGGIRVGDPRRAGSVLAYAMETGCITPTDARDTANALPNEERAFALRALGIADRRARETAQKILRSSPRRLTDRPLATAHRFASIAHDGQMRKTGTRYIAHPERAGARSITAGQMAGAPDDETRVIGVVALSHDIGEKSKVPRDYFSASPRARQMSILAVRYGLEAIGDPNFETEVEAMWRLTRPPKSPINTPYDAHIIDLSVMREARLAKVPDNEDNGRRGERMPLPTNVSQHKLAVATANRKIREDNYDWAQQYLFEAAVLDPAMQAWEPDYFTTIRTGGVEVADMPNLEHWLDHDRLAA